MENDQGVPIPQTVKVGPFWYAIVVDPAEYVALHSSPDLYGQTDHKTATITLNPSLSRPVLAETLWHEIKHAVYRVAGWDRGRIEEEDAVTRASSIEVAVLRENPHLVRYLTQPD